MIEKEMRPAVDAWLRSRGCQLVVFEAFPLQLGSIDVLGIRFDKRVGREIPPARLIAVELKLSRISAVIYQAHRAKLVTQASWAAMPTPFVSRILPASRAKFRRHGVGLLAVDGDKVEIVFPPTDVRHHAWAHFNSSQRIRNYVKGQWARHRREVDV